MDIFFFNQYNNKVDLCPYCLTSCLYMYIFCVVCPGIYMFPVNIRMNVSVCMYVCVWM